MECAFVYYRIDSAHAFEAAGRIDDLLKKMASHCMLPPRRLCRCDDPDTWMEIYEGIADLPGFVTALQNELRAGRADHFVVGERHLECFRLPETTA